MSASSGDSHDLESQGSWNHFLKLGIKNLYMLCLLHRTVADDVLFWRHFTDLDYLYRFSEYERFCEPRYL